MPNPNAASVPPHLVLYDGVCGLCDRAVQWLLDKDTRRILSFAALQGETAALLRKRHPEIPANLDTVVYLERGRVYLRSKAFIHIAHHLGRPWRWAYALRWLPAFPLDLAYRLIARIRYRIFGKLDSCRMPTPEERQRFLP